MNTLALLAMTDMGAKALAAAIAILVAGAAAIGMGIAIAKALGRGDPHHLRARLRRGEL